MSETVFLLSATSDIGTALAERYAARGCRVVGTYRTEEHLPQLKNVPGCRLYRCDVGRRESVDGFLGEYGKDGAAWDVFISLPCTPLPLGPFFDCDFDAWSESVHVNALEQLRVLHGLYPFRNKARTCDVVLFAGGGVNNAVLNFSAYTASKILLVKMCELLDAENADLNVFIVGPGWTKTKTHEITLSHVDKKDKKYAETLEFMARGAGTPMDDIHGCVEWLRRQGKAVSGGRNFSVVNDQWKGAKSPALAAALKEDSDMYKLRRQGNLFLVEGEVRRGPRAHG